MRRVVAAALAALVARLMPSLSAATGAGAPPASPTTSTYDVPHAPSSSVRTLTDRGPPATNYGERVRQPAADQGSHGPSARPQAASTRSFITYDRAVHLAQVASGQGATRTASHGSPGDLRTFAGAVLATNTAAALPKALSGGAADTYVPSAPVTAKTSTQASRTT